MLNFLSGHRGKTRFIARRSRELLLGRQFSQELISYNVISIHGETAAFLFIMLRFLYRRTEISLATHIMVHEPALSFKEL